VHVIPEREYLANFFGHLGVADRVSLVPTEHVYGARFPGLAYLAPGSDPGGFVEEHVRHFPHEAEGLRRFWRAVDQTFQDVNVMSMRIAIRDLDEAVQKFPTLFKYRTAVLDDVLREHLTDPRARAACAATWPYVGSPPSQASFLHWAMMMRTLIWGANHCLGGFQNLRRASSR
jgi:phytoene dehydrogenase-like protein